MQKCDMCFDRTSAGKKPMCCTVCPTGALFYGTLEQVKALRPNSKPINKWRFGNQLVETRVYVMVPLDVEEMVVDWLELLQGADGPFDLAIRLRERYERMGVVALDSREPLPLELSGARITPQEGEAEFL